ncbi:MAG TPA: hypothetical protein VGB01_06705 [candidate division Zixibacteria bacterium]
MNHPGIEDNIITIVEAFTEIFENFKKFIYLKSTDHYVIASLFTLLTYCYHEMDSVPYLYLYGPPSTGKGELLLKFKILCFNPIYAVRLTNAATCRALNERRGTFLLNEADILGKRGGSFILAIFLNGYKKEGEVFICDKKGDGLLRYEVFSPKVFATTTWVPITALLSRCLIIPMVKPDYKNRPKTFHTATDGKALEVLTRKIKRLFEETNLRQQIMEAYLNLEEIREIWGNGDDFIYRKNLNTPSDIVETSLDALMDLLSCPHLPVFKVLQDVNLTGSFWNFIKPAMPVTIIGKPVLPGAGFKDLIPGFRP